IAAITAAILCATAMLLTLERSAWISVIVGLIVWLFLSARSAGVGRSARQWRAALVVGVFGLLIGIGFLTVTDVDATVAARAQEISTAVQGKDVSFAWRVQKWRGTTVMVARRPVWGWGPGQYVLYQYPFTDLCSYPGNSLRTERDYVWKYGAAF